MKKIIILAFLLSSSILFAQKICTTAPNGDIICTDDENPGSPISEI